MKNQVLVLTATLGTRPSLGKTIESVREIGGQRVRHVVVCPLERMAAIQAAYGEIECIPEPAEGGGIYAALNHGFRSLGGEYAFLTFINDDDYWLPPFGKLLDAIMGDEHLDLVYGRTYYFNADGVKIGTQTCSGRFPSFVQLMRHGIALLTQQATIVRSRAFFEVGGFDESYQLVADTKFWAQLSLLPIRYKYVQAICAAYTVQSGQLSSDKVTQRAEFKRLLSEFPQEGRKSWREVWAFRLANLPIYLKRLTLQRGHIRSPFTPPMWVKALIVGMPWPLKRHFLTKYLLYQIDARARIGFSWVFPRRLVMGPGACIGHLNVVIHLERVVMEKNTTISQRCWVTGFPKEDKSCFQEFPLRKPQLIMEEGSAITKKHHVDCTDEVRVGRFTSIGGYDTQILTHSTDLKTNRQGCHPIRIGERCFVGTRCVILGGSVLPNHCVLGAGAVLNKALEEEWTLYAGVPAREVKKLSKDLAFLSRSYRPGQLIVDEETMEA